MAPQVKTFNDVAEYAKTHTLTMNEAQKALESQGFKVKITPEEQAKMDEWAGKPDPAEDLTNFRMSGRFVFDLPDGRKIPFEVNDLAQALVNGISFEDSKDLKDVNYSKEEGVLRFTDSNGKTYEVPMSEAMQKQLTAKVDKYNQERQAIRDAKEYAENESMKKGYLGGMFTALVGALGIGAPVAGALAGTAAAAIACADQEQNNYQGTQIKVINNYDDCLAALKALQQQVTFADQNNQKKIDDLLKLISDFMKQNQADFKDLKDGLKTTNETVQNIDSLMETLVNQVSQKLLDAIDAVKKSINDNGVMIGEKLDTTNEKLETANGILAEIRDLLSNLPNNLKVMFQDDINAIINGIADNGDKLDSMNKILKWINTNLKKNNELTKENGKKLDNLFALMKKFSQRTGTQLDVIIGKLTAQGKRIDDLMTLLCRLDANQEERNNKVINAINNAAGYLGSYIHDAASSLTSVLVDGFNAVITTNEAGFNSLIQQGNTTNGLLAQIGNVVNAIYEKPVAQFDSAGIIRAIQDNGVTLEALYAGLSVVNDNIVQSDANNVKLLNAILANLPKGQAASEGKDYTNLLNAILNKIPSDSCKCDVDAIVNAINNKEISVTIEGGKCCCGQGENYNPTVHEGVLTDLEDLLG